MPLTNFPKGISSFGVPVLGGAVPASPGKYFFVNYGTGIDGAGRGRSVDRPYKTVAYALTQCTTDNDDVICLMGSAVHVLTSMLTVSINRVHIIGIDGTNGRFYGQNAKVYLGITGVATNIGTMINTGVRNSFTNIKFMNADTVTQGLYTVVEGGEYTLYNGCEFYKETLLNGTTVSEFVSNGDSTQILNCTFGSLANLQVGDIIRASVRVTKGLAGTGLVSRDVTFKGCYFWKSAGGTTGAHVYGANATDVERMMIFDDCKFINNKLATAVPAQCVQFGASLTVGQVLINNCVSINNTKLSSTTGVFVQGSVPTGATTGIAVQGA